MVAAVMALGCGGKAADVANTPDLSTVEMDAGGDDLTAPADLAWTDLAGGVDIATLPHDLAKPLTDMAQPADLRPPPPDMVACFADQRYGMDCTANYQCCNLCSYSNVNPSGYACCIAKGQNCQTSAQCCATALHGAGLCSTVCQ